jgi:hypothetical protein
LGQYHRSVQDLLCHQEVQQDQQILLLLVRLSVQFGLMALMDQLDLLDQWVLGVQFHLEFQLDQLARLDQWVQLDQKDLNENSIA